jgi:hypothetical protein
MSRPSRQHEIGIWLKGLLGAGRRKAEDVIVAAVAAGYATNPGDGTRTLRRVKTALGILSGQENEIWYWRDPAVEQAKPASEDKLDILTHKVDEAIRLAMPAVPVVPVPGAVTVEQKPIGITGRKSRTIDINDPEVQKQLARDKEALDRFDEVQGVVTSVDPFKLLVSADLDEIDRMMLLVHEHLAELETRSQGKPKYRKAWEVTERFEKQTTTREFNVKKQEWVDVPATEIEEKKYISDVPIEGAKPVDVPDGFEIGEDVTLEVGKWETWIDRAKEHEFSRPDSGRGRSLKWVLST